MIPYSTKKLQQHFATLLQCCNLAKKFCCNFSVLYGLIKDIIIINILNLELKIFYYDTIEVRSLL